MDSYGGHVLMWMFSIIATGLAVGIVAASIYMLFTVLWPVPVIVWSFVVVSCAGAWLTAPKEKIDV